MNKTELRNKIESLQEGGEIKIDFLYRSYFSIKKEDGKYHLKFNGGEDLKFEADLEKKPLWNPNEDSITVQKIDDVMKAISNKKKYEKIKYEIMGEQLYGECKESYDDYYELYISSWERETIEVDGKKYLFDIECRAKSEDDPNGYWVITSIEEVGQ